MLNSSFVDAARSFGLFGEISSKGPLGPSSPAVEYNFAGYSFDRATERYLTGYWLFDPKIGRWLSQEPLGPAGDVNFYRYAGNNPSRFVDLTGLEYSEAGGGDVGGDEGVQLLVDYYQDTADPAQGETPEEYAHAAAYQDRYNEDTENLDETSAAAEHYLWAMSELRYNEDPVKDIAYDFLPSGYQGPKWAGFFPNATPASQLELRWAQKGVNDAHHRRQMTNSCRQGGFYSDF